MLGAAAAKYLAREGRSVALLGPDEPKDRKTHSGVFASHHDAGRITRTIDEDRDWALMARRSIARYHEIEEESGVPFFSEVGCLVAALENGADSYVDRAVLARDAIGLEALHIAPETLGVSFPHLRFPGRFAGLFERCNAGYVDPRALVRAQTRLAEGAGAEVRAVEVAALHDQGNRVEVVTQDGTRVFSESVVVAVGGYAVRNTLFPRPLDLTVKARSVLLVEVDGEERTRLADLPSVIQSTGRLATSFYVLPPIRYPDGRYYIKIGGDPVDVPLKDEDEIRAWFRGDGDKMAAAQMERNLLALLPNLKGGGRSVVPCVTTYTRHGYPYIGFVGSERIIALVGGNGKAAKSSDEIGRLGARFLTTGSLAEEGYHTSFDIEYDSQS
jgi:sarcosine oxidase